MAKISIKKPLEQISRHISVPLLGAVGRYVLPRMCPVCGAPVRPPGVGSLCSRCMFALPVCHRRGHELLETRGMLLNASVPVSAVEALMNYDPADPYARIVRTLKYDGRPDIGRAMGRYLALRLLSRPADPCETHFSTIDAILPIPMHPLKRLRRGYNQAEEIARGMADAAGAALADNLMALRPHTTQTHLTFGQRSANLRHCFNVTHPHELDGLNIALVDDIITTGATMAEALMAISRSGARPASISIYALGATLPHA